MIDTTEKQFLNVFRCALNDLPVDEVKGITEKEWPGILRVADIHRVYPMIYEYAYQMIPEERINSKAFQRRKEKAVKLTCDQAQMTAEFLNLYRFLLKRGLSPIIMKGIICRKLYPDPERRSSSDEDLLIPQEQFPAYQKAFKEYGLHVALDNADEEKDHEVPYCNSKVYIELHKSPFAPNSKTFGELNRYFAEAESRKITEKIYGVPVCTMEYTDHLFYQICHAYKHFLNCGIGIRIVSDIVLFSITYHGQIDWDRIIQECHEIKAYEFMRAVYKIGAVHLFTERFPDELYELFSLEDIDESELLEDILNGGLYGTSSENRLHSSNITLHAAEAESIGEQSSAVMATLFPSLASMKRRYPYLEKYPFLLPFGWLQRLVSYLRKADKKNNNATEAMRIGNERVALMKKYKIIEEKEKTGFLKRLYQKSHRSVFAPVLSVLYRGVSMLEYWFLNTLWYIQGHRGPSEEDRKLVRENVTFLFKSFERQKLAAGLCRNISRMYPGVRIIVADDSREPLESDLNNVQVIHLPFNSGLSAGLKAALNEVQTPYLVRMDDDELLTIRTNLHRELRYLQEHSELDLIGFGFTTAIRCRDARRCFDDYYQKTMPTSKETKIPHGTQLDDNHVVFEKTANIYVARTDKIRQVGFDENIKVIDHHDFFLRAQGIITSAAALDTVVFHRHNPYDRHYYRYRSDYLDDLIYLRNKKSKGASK